MAHSRLRRDSLDINPNDYRIYVTFCATNPRNNTIATFIDCYTPSTNSCHRVTSIPDYHENFVLKDFAMVALGDHIYLIGGRLCCKLGGRESSVAHQENIPRAVSCVRKYNVRTDEWDKCTPMRTPRFNFACTVSNNKIYVAGGQSALGSANGISSTEVYDPAWNQWKSLAPMNNMRYKCVAVTWQDKIHVMGGFVGGGGSPGPFVMTRSSAEVYDAKQDKWVFIPRMWDLDIPPNQIVAVNGKLFSSGDCFHHWKGHIEAYDEKESIWNVVLGSNFNCLPPTSTPEVNGSNMRRCYLTMAPIGNKLYFLAGYRMPGEVPRMRSAVHVFDTAVNGDGWQSFDPIEEEGEKELCGHCCVLRHD